MASWPLVSSSPDRAFRVRTLPGDIVLCSWTRHLTLTVPLSTLGRIVRKPVNANPGLKVDWGNNFSCIKVLSIASVLGSLRLLMPKTEGQKI